MPSRSCRSSLLLICLLAGCLATPLAGCQATPPGTATPQVLAARWGTVGAPAKIVSDHGGRLVSRTKLNAAPSSALTRI